MKKIALILSTLACVGFLKPQPAKANDLSGFYISGGVGGGAIVHELSVPDFLGLSLNGLGGEGFLGTVGVGYDMHVSPELIFGVFADFDFTSIESEFKVDNTTIDLPVDNVINVGLRLGYSPTPDSMLFVSGGYSKLSMGNLEVPGLFVFDPGDFDGFFVGGGIETRLMNNLFGKVEYRYSEYSENRYFDFFEIDPSTHVGRFTIAYKFGPLSIPDAEPLK